MQTVFIINQKLDKAINKMRFLNAQLILVGGTDAKVKSDKERKLCTRRDLDWDPNEITLEYVLEMSI